MMRNVTKLLALPTFFLASIPASALSPAITFNDSSWCWFEDERSIVVNGQLTIGTVPASFHNGSRSGHTETTTYDLSAGSNHRSVLHRDLQLNDHHSPAFYTLGDRRILATY